MVAPSGPQSVFTERWEHGEEGGPWTGQGRDAESHISNEGLMFSGLGRSVFFLSGVPHGLLSVLRAQEPAVLMVRPELRQEEGRSLCREGRLSSSLDSELGHWEPPRPCTSAPWSRLPCVGTRQVADRHGG